MKHAAPAAGRLLRAALCFAAVSALLLGFLLLSALIPRESVAPKMLESAEYLHGQELYGHAVPEVESSRIDRYADSILLGIALQYDGSDPLRSVLVSAYYHEDGQAENDNLLKAVRDNLPANQQYIRYWHGSAGIVRCLSLLLNLPQIYLLHGILLSLLALSLFIRLLRQKAFVPMAGLAAGLIGVSCWFIPLSLEYTWVFLILMVQLHLICCPSFPTGWERRGLFFLISGMVTNYLDFLTCEVLTLLLPLLFLLERDRRNGLPIPGWKKLLTAALYWAAGYGGMFLLKWGLAALATGENVLPYIVGHVEERLAGNIEDMSLPVMMLGALQRNLKYLFPAGCGTVGMLLAIGILAAAGYVGYVYRRPGAEKAWILCCAVFGLVPYLRYILLSNHSYLHAFFTCRLQLVTIFAAALILGELTDKRRKSHGRA